MYNVVVGKLGKKFYLKKKMWLIDSGDSEVATSLIVLAKKHANINFYIIGSSDLDKFRPEEIDEYFPNNNVFYVWNYFDKKSDKYTRQEFPFWYFTTNNINIDFGWIHAGPASGVNIPEHTYKVRDIEKKEFAKPINMAKIYAGPTIHFLNASKIPYVVLGEDPRYFPVPARDLFNRPLCYLNAYNDTVDFKYFDNYFSTTQIEKKEKLIDAKYDRWFLASEAPVKKKFEDKNILLDVYTNGRSSAGSKKLKIIKEYLGTFPETKIYGKWSDDLIAKGKDFTFDETAMVDMTDKLYKTKYTLMFHFEEGYPSSKFWKMIYFGIIPFYHSNMDVQHNQPVHDYCRIKSPKELQDKISELESNLELQNEIRNYHYNLFTSQHFDGSIINKVFVKFFNQFTDKEIQNLLFDDYKRVSVLFPTQGGLDELFGV